MGIVAIRTAHLAFRNRVVRRPVDLGALLLVAGKTDIRLSALAANLVIGSMNLMAIGTGNITQLVGASFPMGTFGVLLVAAYAGFVSNFS